jgi:carbonic anhydrase/acetyltransferase-like protein (isoleucine patch superfamily)
MLYRYLQFKPAIDKTAFIAPNAVLIGQVKIASGASVWFHTLLRGDINTIAVGKDSNIQDGCTMHVTHEHSVTVEERVTVGHNVILHGCHVKSDCLIGMGSIILDGVVIHEGCLIAAGSVVSPNTVIPANSLVMGVPGRVVRTLAEKERERMSTNWKSYVEYSQAYRDPAVFEQID